MSMLSDFDEFIKEWKGKGLFFKFIAIISLFLAISSIASLSDTVFQWKGFILDGIKFYKANINLPIQKIFTKLGLYPSKTKVDLFVCMNIFWLPVVKVRLKHFYNIFKNNKKSKVIGVFDVSLVLLILFLPLFGMLNQKPISAFIIVIMIVIISLISTIIYKSKKARKQYAPMLISIIFVFILAAINLGLKK